MISEVTWEPEPHTIEAKHAILRRYLQAWFPIMADYARKAGLPRLVYIDGFAGPGEYKGGLDGSPVIAIKTLLGHSRWEHLLKRFNYTFLFIEKTPRFAQHLRQRLSQLTIPFNVQITVEQAEFEAVLTNLLGSLQQTKQDLAPAFVFIDPFGPTGFPMDLVQQIMRYRGSEVLIMLNLQALIQWMIPVPDRVQDVNNLYGGVEWQKCLALPPDEKEDCLRRTYSAQLKEASQHVPTGVQVLTRDFRMVNRHNRTAYYLVYATHDRTGLRVMKETMWAVDASGAFMFSDITNPNQQFLFSQEFDEAYGKDYARELLSVYAGQPVEKNKLEAHTDEHERYLRRHLTKALDCLESEHGVVPSRRRRGRGWPKETTFTFPLARTS